MSSSNHSRAVKQANSHLMNPTHYQIRSLVLDYLFHHCYTKTAKAFARDSTVRQLDPDGNEIPSKIGSAELPAEVLKQVELRERIQALILSGRVDDAADTLKEHFPSVISDSTLTFNTHASVETPRTTPINTAYVSPTSIDPAHLSLNLRMQSFVEACRTIPLEYPPTSTADDVTMLSTHEIVIPDENSPEFIERQQFLIEKARKLKVLVDMVPKRGIRALYTQELKNVAGLLAYRIPETYKTKYLTQERREAVADQINRAILSRTGHSSISSLELATRYTSTLWSFAHQHGAKPRLGALLPIVNYNATQSSRPLDKELEVVPPFDLQHFLDSKA